LGIGAELDLLTGQPEKLTLVKGGNPLTQWNFKDREGNVVTYPTDN